MTALPPDAVADLYKLVSELEQRLESSFAAHDAEIERGAATAEENTRLRNELLVARERQAASAEILATIANTSGDAEGSLQQIAETTGRLFDATSVSIRIADGDEWGLSIRFGAGPERIAAQVPEEQRRVGSRNLPGTVFRENRQIHIPDLDNIDPAMADWPVMAARAAGIRTVAGTPLRREGKAIGALIVYRDRLAPFGDDELALQQGFADQAAIALENARLFNETKEALEQQQASGEVLGVISSSVADTSPVFDRILDSCERLVPFERAAIFVVDAGDQVHLATGRGSTPESVADALRTVFPQPLDRTPMHRAFAEGRVVIFSDVANDPDAPWTLRTAAAKLGSFSVVVAPMLWEGRGIGAIHLSRAADATFTAKEVALLKTFADQAVIAIQNARLFNETKEALERQTATADILKVIASSPSDAQPVFDAIALSAKRLLTGFSAAMFRYIDGSVHLAAFTPVEPAADAALKADFPAPAEEFVAFRLARDGQPFAIPDTEELSHTPVVEIARKHGFRSMLWVPMMSGGIPIGLLSVTRAEPGAFASHHTQLLQTFADQAVIAIENARLFNETREALERQTATADILKVIASSPSDVQPVFDVIVERAVRLCGARMGRVYRYDGDQIHLVGGHGLSVPARDSAERPFPRPASDDTIVGRVMLARRANILADLDEDDTVPPLSRQMISALGARSQVTMPMLLAGEPIGAITLSWAEPRGYTDQTIALLQTFADQAVIAIENVRLFNEVQQRTEDLSESLQQQTAVGDVLKIISRSAFDLQPVLDTLVNTAALLCDAEMAFLMRREGELYRAGAAVGFNEEYVEFLRNNPLKVDRGSITGRAVLERRTVQILDVAIDPEYTLRESTTLARQHTALCVPLLRENEPIGTIVLARQRVEAFTQKQIELVTTFADQAVIAIENVRLFDEVRKRTDDLTEALTYQTGSANILKVIASSPTDVEPVLKAIVENACGLCDAHDAIVFLENAGELHSTAHRGPIPQGLPKLPITRTRIAGRAFLDRHPVHVRDFHSAEGAQFPDGQELALRLGHRTMLAVPLVREGESIGVIVLRRNEVNPFSDKQIALLQTFADQAVIAIGNVRLFDEVQAKTRDLTEALTYQTGSANILRVIASSPTDVTPVLEAIVESACQLCGAYDALVRLRQGDGLAFGAHHGPLPVSLDSVPITENSTAGRAVIGQMPVHVHDLFSPEGDSFPVARALAREHGERTILSVPLLRENESIGAIVLRRAEVHPFSDKQIALLQTFADQAVIAIGNVRLFDEVQAKTRDLTEALTYQTGSGNILRVIASSPTDVKPVLKAIVESACELCEADDALAALKDGDELVFQAQHGSIPVVWDRQPIDREGVAGLAVIDRTAVHVHDLLAPEGDQFPRALEFARKTGVRTVLCVPLLREGESIGIIILRRTEVSPFSDKQIALLQTFADQAVIAIGNVRLFEEVQARTEDLRESLQIQTATSDVLKVISRSPDALQPVLDVIVDTSRELCGSDAATLFLLRDNRFHFTAISGAVPKHVESLRATPREIGDPGSVFTRVAQQRRTLHYPNILDDPELAQGSTGIGGPRALLLVPLMRDEEVIGTIVLRQSHLRPFTPRQIQAIEVFADQAVIAISNVGLFEEVQARTRDLTESLQQQTATSEVLSVISRSAGDLEPVFQSMLENATRICSAQFGLMNLYEGGSFHTVGFHNVPPEFAAARAQSFRPHPVTALAQMVQTKKFAHIDDLRSSPPYLLGDPATLQLADMAGARTVVIVPMIKDDEFIGTIGIYRLEVLPFNEKQVALLSSFASQAVIAIENTRLLRELRQRTDDLTKSLDDLRTAQGRLVQTEKLASLGQLTAGIAHEIKNPLNFVNNFAALSAELTDELNDVLKQAEISGKIRGEVDELTGLLKDNLQKVVQHGKRADSIVKNMLLHSREGSGEHRPTDINALVDESLNLAYHGARAEKPDFNVTLQRDFDADAGMIEVFPQEITRVFLNLVSNGFYAVTRRKAEAREGGFDPVLLAATRNLGDAVEIRIRDNGTGIPQDVKDKMFNPFFTTKPAGEGTGLGLSMSHDIIVKQHGGTIDVDTEPGQFTEFRIVLPRNSKSSK